MSPSVEQILRKAKRYTKEGETDLAAQQYKTILEKYPQNKQAIAGVKALQQPNSEDSQQQINELIVLFNQGNFRQALIYGEALEKQLPNIPLIPNLLGAVNAALGLFEQAVVSYSKALQIKPDYAEAHNNLGVALNSHGKNDEAVASYTKALQIKPDYAEAINNLGIALYDLGKIGEAVANYKKALQIKPDYAEAHNNLGVALKSLGKTDEAITHFRESVVLAPHKEEFLQNFSGLLRNITFKAYNEQWAKVFLTLLAQKTLTKPRQFAKPILNLLKHHPSIREALQKLNSGDLHQTIYETCNSLSDIPLFLRIIEISPIFDLDVEKLLTTLRRALLLNANEAIERPGILNFQLSLALHCFTNEYIFAETDEEEEAIQSLETNIARVLANAEEPSPFALACLASYRPLHIFSWSRQLTIPESLIELFELQVRQVCEEASIREKIQTYGQIDNDQVSKAVRTQYEENPYPRWINTALSTRPVTILELANTLKLKLDNGVGHLAHQPEILIAGCGTGQHALGTATRFSNSKVLAVDLSLNSLSYAIRKTQELGISNIEYLQADILNLDSMEKQFDLVQSSGVLHHMADPMAGWKILTDRLKPGGLMKIGLYSELARKSVVEARELIADMGFPHRTKEILEFRAAILDSNGEMFSKIHNLIDMGDFFSTSEFRDLLFHVQEHRFTLPQIKENLEVLGLSFAGFEIEDNKITKNFMQVYPEPQSIFCLDAWHEFELANIDTFSGMYQFWVQKKVNL